MNANVKCFILCIYKTILKPSKQFLTVSNHKVFSLHALWMTILRPSRQLLTVSNHQVFRFYTLLKLSKVFHPSICSSFVLDLRRLLLRVSRWITNMLVLSKYLLTVLIQNTVCPLSATLNSRPQFLLFNNSSFNSV